MMNDYWHHFNSCCYQIVKAVTIFAKSIDEVYACKFFYIMLFWGEVGGNENEFAPGLQA
jgi:hypothetical protein